MNMQILDKIKEKLEKIDCHYSDGTKSNCPWYNLADVFDPQDD